MRFSAAVLVVPGHFHIDFQHRQLSTRLRKLLLSTKWTHAPARGTFLGMQGDRIPRRCDGKFRFLATLVVLVAAEILIEDFKTLLGLATRSGSNSSYEAGMREIVHGTYDTLKRRHVALAELPASIEIQRRLFLFDLRHGTRMCSDVTFRMIVRILYKWLLQLASHRVSAAFRMALAHLLHLTAAIGTLPDSIPSLLSVRSRLFVPVTVLRSDMSAGAEIHRFVATA